jgi:hypothetical protein
MVGKRRVGKNNKKALSDPIEESSWAMTGTFGLSKSFLLVVPYFEFCD